MSPNEETIEKGKEEVECKNEMERRNRVGWKGEREFRVKKVFWGEHEISGKCGVINFHVLMTFSSPTTVSQMNSER